MEHGYGDLSPLKKLGTYVPHEEARCEVGVLSNVNPDGVQWG